MKTKISKNQIYANFKKENCFQIGYCQLQHLFSENRAIWYNRGVYGWNCDIYDLGCYCITTGYRPFGRTLPVDILQKYEKVDAKIHDQKDRDAAIASLINDLQLISNK